LLASVHTCLCIDRQRTNRRFAELNARVPAPGIASADAAEWDGRGDVLAEQEQSPIETSAISRASEKKDKHANT
jgi:hypothetical protein